MPSTFVIPDFISCCPYMLQVHPNGERVEALSEEWFRRAFPNFSPTQEKKLKMLMAGRLCTFVYIDADDERLQRSCDLMHLILYYGDVTDDLDLQANKAMADLMMNAFAFPEKFETSIEPPLHKLARQFWLQCLPNASLGFLTRFIEDIGFFLEARYTQAVHRHNNILPDIEEYIEIRRDSSAFKPVFDFLEYTLQADFPDEVMEHPVVQSLKECANDFCTWANDIYSYNKEQARGDTYNLVVLVMRQYGLGLQEAIDTVGDKCFNALDNFEIYKKQLPSWGSQIDRDLRRYIRGLENYMIGSLEWGYISGRYFGEEGLKIRNTRIVKLLPRQKQNARAALLSKYSGF